MVPVGVHVLQLLDHFASRIAHHAQHSWEAEDVVSVHVSDENLGHVGDLQLALHESRLRRLPAVEEPRLVHAPVHVELQRQARYVSVQSRGAPRRPQESDLKPSQVPRRVQVVSVVPRYPFEVILDRDAAAPTLPTVPAYAPSTRRTAIGAARAIGAAINVVVFVLATVTCASTFFFPLLVFKWAAANGFRRGAWHYERARELLLRMLAWMFLLFRRERRCC